MIIITKKLGDIVGSRQNIVITGYVDTQADLPSATSMDNYTIVTPSELTVVYDGSKWMIDETGTWRKQPGQFTLDLSGYYTSAQTDSAISTALSTYTTDTLNKAVSYDRGTQILATTDEHFNVFGITTRGAWYFGASVVQYMDNMPSTFPSSGGGQIRVYENQGTNRFLMEITANSVAGSGKIWRCWYTSAGWGSWYEFSGTQLT